PARISSAGPTRLRHCPRPSRRLSPVSRSRGLPRIPATRPQHERSGTGPHSAYACRNSENPLITSFPGCFHIFIPRVCKDFQKLQVIANVTSPSMPATDPGPPVNRMHDLRQASRKERSEEHTSELQSRFDLVCRLLLEKKKHNTVNTMKQTTSHVEKRGA